MPSSTPSAAALARVVLACAVGLPAWVVTIPANAGTADPSVASCTATTLEEPVRLTAALEDGMTTETVRTENDLTRAEVSRLARDRSSWVDECGHVFVVDRAAHEAQQDTTTAFAAQLPTDVFDLSSRPTSDRTVHLDFDGATYAGTRWNGGAEIVSPAYSVDADPTTFSDVERAQIYLAWQVVAEDFAPFDINVTTRPPAASALTRTSTSDTTYGMPVVITPTNSVGSGCGCGGQAYVGVFDVVGTTAYQPAWVFTNGSGVGGYNMGQVISHEVGHTLGLGHDGTSQNGYYSGAKGWAPIMGSSYNRRASQWSSGEYPDANNPQDDVAIIARTAPTVADDHAAGIAGATPIGSGTTTGAITSRNDTDAFSFVARGTTTLAVAGPSAFSDLDVQVTVLDSNGAAVATVNPTADIASDASMGTTWTVDVPLTGVPLTAVVDGVGFGSPVEAGRYSDFGSLGAYTINLTTQSSPPAPTPTTQTPDTTPTTQTPDTAPTETATPTLPAGEITFVTRRLPRGTAGVRYRATIRFAGPVREALVDRRLPRGLTWRVQGDTIRIRGTVQRPTARRFTSKLTGDGTSVRQRFRLVVR